MFFRMNMAGMIIASIFLISVLILVMIPPGGDVLGVILCVVTSLGMGFIFLAADRLSCKSRSREFIVSVAWVVYWGYVAFLFLMLASIIGFVIQMGHGGAGNNIAAILTMYLFLTLTLGFIGLALANIVRLFFIPKRGA